jgi:FkbM family methyltransferase
VLRVVLGARLKRAEGPGTLIGVPVKALGGSQLYVRPRTSDLRNATYYYTDDLYLPPAGIAALDLRQICEFGSNMGAALAALAHRYPQAKILGVEPDPGNAAVARRNIERFGERGSLVEAGIWDSDTTLVVDRATHYGEHGFTVRERLPEDPADMATIPARSIDSLLAEHAPEGVIDYVHMTVEGTEPRVLRSGGEWVKRVRSMRVEAHPELGYAAEDLITDLERLGYRAWAVPRFPDKWVYALKG